MCPNEGWTDCQERGDGDWDLDHLKSFDFVEGSSYNLIVQNGACAAITNSGSNFDGDWEFTY